MKKLLPLLALAALALPASAVTDEELRAITPAGFSRAAVFTVDGYAGSTPLTNFPVLVKIKNNSPSGFDYADLNFPAAGEEHDLGFVDMEGNGLAFDLDEWNSSGTSIYWVNVPIVTNGTQFVMVYRSAQTGKSLNGNNAFADYAGVWHLGETATKSTTIKDSTDNHLDGTSHENSSPLAAGAIGGARQINTTDNNSGMANGIQVALGAANSAERAVVDGLIPEFTASFWWRHPKNVNTRWNCVIGRKNGNADPAWGLQFDLQNGDYSPIRVFSAGTADSQCQKPSCPQRTREVWYKVDLVYYLNPTDATKGKFILYWNGGTTATTNDTYNGVLPGNSTGDFCIGGGGGRPYRGWMDEVRLRKFVPTADWVKADYDQAKEDASFLSAAEVVEFVELPKPVIGATREDFGAAFVQFSGSVSKLGGSATSCDVYAKVWPVGGSEPPDGTLLASGLGAGRTFTDATVTNLAPQTEYQWKVYAVNDLSPTAYESDPVTGPTFETAGVGGAGTGGVVSRVVDDYVHVFEIALDGTATYEFTPPAGVTEAEVLLVAGGGAGGFYAGGGGGAGGLVHDTALALSGGTTYMVTVGDGGQPASSLTDYGNGSDGGDSLITSAGGATTNAIAFGGGGGGNGPFNSTAAAENAGRDGGSGGGSAHYSYAAGSGTPGQGSDGGLGLLGTPGQSGMTIKAGGGGGAGGNGGNAQYGSTHIPGTGGSGVQLDITGTATWYAGGGSGGGAGRRQQNGNRDYRVAGGVGGGGTGGVESDIPGDEDATPGTDGLGGGGGGGSTKEGHYRGGAGGSGVVVVRYPATGTGAGATEPTVSLTGLEYDSANNVATLSYRVAWAGEGYQTADVAAIWGYSEDALVNEVPLDTDDIGRGTGTITGLPSVSRTVYVKVRATNAGNASGVSTETKTIALYNPAAPEATIENTAVDFDGGTFTVDVTNLGRGASSAVVSLQSCANRAFASGVVTNADLATLATAGDVSVKATGLTDSSTWWVRAVVTNNIGEFYESDPVSVTTLAPGYPAGAGAISDVGYTSVTALTRVTNRGLGSTETARWLEVSEDENFATLVGTSEPVLIQNLNDNRPTTATGLRPATAYHVRLAISNNWNRITYVRLNDITTRAEPFAASGPAWTALGGTLDFSLAVAAVYDGAECEAALTYGGNAIGTRTFTEAGTVSWPGVPAAADGAVARIVVTATLPEGGGTISKTYSAPVAAGSGGTAVADISTYCSAAGALWVRPGDTVSLPALFGNASYQVLNERFATIEGSTLTALEPGIVGVRCVNAANQTNVMGVVILPDPIGAGKVYVYDETKIQAAGNENAYNWSNPTCWVNAADGTRVDCPTNADDIAVVPFYIRTGDQYIRHRTDITLGGLYAGQIRPDATTSCNLERYKDDSTKTVTFRRTDGGPIEIKVCPNNDTASNSSAIQFGGFDINVTWASDILMDGCSSETDVNGPRGLIKFKDTAVITNTVQDAKITVQGFPGYYVNGNGGTTKFHGVWKGTGEIVKKGQGSLVFPDDFSGFSGIVRDATGPTLGNLGAPSAGVLMRAAGASNFVAHVYGWAPYNHDTGAMSYNGLSRGTLGTGSYSVGPAKGAQGPAKGLHLHGGAYRANNIDNASWGVGVADEKAFDVLEAGAGFSYVTLVNGAGNGSGKPINAVTAKTLAQTEKGTLAVYDPSINEKAALSVTNATFTVGNWAALSTGGTGYGELNATGASDDFTIIPWMAANGDKDFSYLVFPAVDANGRLVRPVRTTTYIDTAKSAQANAVCPDGYGSLTRGPANIVVNSLFLNNANNGDKWLGADRTLTITSGGLILHGANGSAIGLPGRDDNGALVLGDATHPAYVWNKAYGAGTNRIWAAVTAPGGFVSTYTGNLELGGDQTGIEDELVAAGGCLALGSSEYGIDLRDELPVRVCAGATLKIAAEGAVDASPVLIDGSGGAFGRIELPGDRRCASISIRDVFESDEWETLPRGTWGATGSGAEFVRDDLFSGPGVLSVDLSDEPEPEFEAVEWIPELATERTGTFRVEAIWLGKDATSAGLDAWVAEGDGTDPFDWASAERQALATLVSRTNATFVVRGLEPETDYVAMFVLSNAIDGAVHAATNGPVAFSTIAPNFNPSATCAVVRAWALAADLSVVVPRFGFEAEDLSALVLRYGKDGQNESAWASTNLALPAAEGGSVFCRLLGLETGTVYRAKVFATNNLVPPGSFETEAVSFETATGDPVDESQPWVEVSSVAPAQDALRVAAQVRWTGFGSDAVRVLYRVATSEAGLDAAQDIVALSGLGEGDDASFDATGLTPGTRYWIRVYAVNDRGDRTASPVFSAAAYGETMTGTAVGAARTFDVGRDRVAVFTNSAEALAFSTVEGGPVEILLVGGGGAGGSFVGGGGGGGGFVHLESLYLAPGTTYAIAVGAGGVPTDTDQQQGGCGGDSTFAGDAVSLVAHGGGGGGGYAQGAFNGLPGGSGGGAARDAARGGASTATGAERGNAGGENDDAHIKGLPSGGGGAGAPGSHAEWGTGIGGAGGDGLPCSITGEEVWYAGGGGAGQRKDQWNSDRDNVTADGTTLLYLPGVGGRGGGGMGCARSDSDLDAFECGVDGLGGGGGGGHGAGTFEAGRPRLGAPGGSGTVIVRWRATPASAASATVSSVAGSARAAIVEGAVRLGGTAGATIQMRVKKDSADSFGEWRTLASGLADGEAFSAVLDGLDAATRYDYEIRTTDGEAEGETLGAAAGSFSTYYTWPAQISAAPDGAETNAVGPDMVYAFATNGTYSFTVSQSGYARILMVGGGGAGGSRRGGGGGAGGFVEETFATLEEGTYTVVVGAGGVPAAVESLSGPGDVGGDGGETVLRRANGEIVYRAPGGGGGGSYSGDKTTPGIPGNAGGSGGGGGPKNPAGGGAATAVSPALGNAGGGGLSGNSGDGDSAAGGGGGAGGPGADGLGTNGANGANRRQGGAGGAGVPSDVTGETRWYAAGGGGGCWSDDNGGYKGLGGSGVGGDGGGWTEETNQRRSLATPGADGTGSGGGGGGQFDRCTTNQVAGGAGGCGTFVLRIASALDYRPAAEIETLSVRDGEPTTADATVSLRVVGFAGAPDVTLLYGPEPDNLAFSVPVASEAAIGVYAASVPGLAPGSTWHFAAAAANSKYATTGAVRSVTIPAAPAPQGEPGAWGLWQTQRRGEADSFRDLFESGTLWETAQSSNLVAGAIAANAKTKTFEDPATGAIFSWDGWNMLYAYRGWIYLDGGKTYAFGSRFADCVRLSIDGDTLIDTFAEPVTDAFGAFGTDAPGWHEIDARVGRTDAVWGPDGNGVDSWISFGLALNDADYQAAAPIAMWTPLVDPGDGSLLRPEKPAARSVQIVSAAAEDGTLSLSGLAGAGGTAARACVVWGGADAGVRSTNDWEGVAGLGEIPASDAATALAATVAGWGSSAKVARLALETDGEWTWSAPVAWTDTEVPSLSGVRVLESSGGDTASFGATAAGGTAPYRATLRVGATADSLADAASATVAEAGEFSIEATDLEPGATYWWQIVLSDANGIVARSDAMTVTMSAASRLFDASDGNQAAWERANPFENRQGTIVFGGQLVTLGAGETTVRLLRNQAYDGFPGAKTTEPHDGEEIVLDATGSYSTSLPFDWDLDVTFNWSVSNSNGRASWGPTASARDDKGWCRNVTVVDATEYAWSGGAAGVWTNAAAWTPDGVWGADVAGYPRRGSYAVFPNAGTFRVAVPDAPEGLPSYRFSQLRLGAGADVTFEPAEGASAPTLRVQEESAASAPRAVSIPLGEGAALRFRNVNATLSENSKLTMGRGSTLEIGEGCVATVGNNPNGGYPWSTSVGEDVSFVFRGSDVTLVGNAQVNGRGSRMVVDDARVSMTYWGNGPVLVLGAAHDDGAASLVLRGADPRLSVSYQLRSSRPDQIIDFEVPEGGWTEAPIRPTSTVGGAFGSGSSAGAAIALRIPTDSPAVVAGETLDVPLVRWPNGVNEDVVVLSSENLPHPATDSFSVETDPATGHKVVWAHLVGQADTDDPQAVGFRVTELSEDAAEISFIAIPGGGTGGVAITASLLDAAGENPVPGASVSLSTNALDGAGDVTASISGLAAGGSYTLSIGLADTDDANTASTNYVFRALLDWGAGTADPSAASSAADGPFTVWTFTNVAERLSFTVTQAGYADVLVVGGGGSGGSGGNGWGGNYGGGGGGGGEVVATNLFLAVGDYRIEVGAGGPRVATRGNGKTGDRSRFDDVFAAGGGYGGSNANGGTGGNGGGGSKAKTGGAPLRPTGYAGGSGDPDSVGGAGGGGGAGGNGADGVEQAGGAGGAGFRSVIAGEPAWYGAGGGGGGNDNKTLSAGGAPGADTAGAGAASDSAVWADPAAVASMDATPGFGGGGGGGVPTSSAADVVAAGAVYGGAGGSGTVIVRMRTATALVPQPQALLKGAEPGVGSVDLTLSVFSFGEGASSATATLLVAKDGNAVTNAFPMGAVDATGWTNFVVQGLRPATAYEGVVRLDNGAGGVLDLPVSFETRPEGNDPFGTSRGAWTDTGAWTAEPLPFADNPLRLATYAVSGAKWTGDTKYLSDGAFTNAAFKADSIGCGLGSGSTVTWTLAEPTDIARLRAWAWWQNENWRRIAIESVEFRDESGEWTTLEASGTLHAHGDVAQSAEFAPTVPGTALFLRATGVRIAFAANALNNGTIYHEFEAFPPAADDLPADLSVLAASRSDTALKAAVGFSKPLQAAAVLTAYVAADYGAEDLSAWEAVDSATTDVAAGAISANVETPAAALGGKTYLRFRYEDDNGVSRWSESVYLPDFPAAASVPPAVAYVATTAVSDGGATLVANLLEAGSGATTADLAIRCALRTNDVDAAASVSFVANASPGERTGTVSGLLPAHTYYAKFVADNGSETGFSDLFSFTTTGERTGPFGADEVAIADLGVAEGGDGATATVRVLATGSGNFSLSLEYGRKPDLSDATVTNLDVSATGDRQVFFRTEPGATYHYRFVATADGGAYDATPIASFATRAGSVLGSGATHANLSHHSATLKGILSVLGAGTTTVYVYAGSGTNDLEETEYSQVLDAIGPFSFAATFPGDPHVVRYAFKAVNVGADGTPWESWSATNKLETVDNVTYTWNAEYTEGSWTNAACWTPNAHADDCVGYPDHTSATAVFANGTKAVVAVPGQYRFNSMSIGKDNVDVTFAGEGADVSLLGCNITGGNTTNSRWTFSALVLEESNGVEFGNKDNLLKAHDSTLVFTDGAVFRIKEWGLQLFGTNQWLVVEKGAAVQATNKGYVIDGTVSGGIRLDNGTISARYVRTHGQFAQTADQSVFLSGEAPRIVLAEYYRNASSNAVDRQNDDTRFVFTVPVAGWAEAPVFSDSATAEPFAALLGDGPGRYAFEIDPDSPLLDTGRTRVVPLVAWSAGIDANHVATVVTDRLKPYVKFRWGWGWPSSPDNEPGAGESPTGLFAEIRGWAGTLLIFR